MSNGAETLDAVVLTQLPTTVVRELAIAEKVCIRPLLRRVLDRESGTEEIVPIQRGSTMEAVCPSCAHKARLLRMQECAEGWHVGKEPSSENDPGHDADPVDQDRSVDQEDRDDRRVRSTKRREDAVDLPRVAAEDRTIGRTFRSPDGREYRPSMFLTLTLPSYGSITDGVPTEPEKYDYRQAAMDALLFRSWWIGSGRTCAAAPVTGCSTSQPSNPNNDWPRICMRRFGV